MLLRLVAWAIEAGAAWGLAWLSSLGEGRRSFHLQLGRRLAKAAENLGPAAVKMAQIAASRGDLIPPEITGPLARLHERAALPTPSQVLEALEDAYGETLPSIFGVVEETAAAAGSVAFVVRGAVRDGRPVAIKLVRHGVAKAIDADLRVMTLLVRAASRLKGLGHLPLVETFELFADQVRRQCDMREEADAAVRFRAMLADLICVPYVHLELCRPSVLVSDWVDGGLPISDAALARDAYETGCRTLLRGLYRMIFQEGFVHLDLHPGNIRVDDGGGVTLFDFGLVATIGVEDRQCFRRFMRAVAAGDAVVAAEELIAAAGSPPPPLGRTALVGDVDRLLRRHTGSRAGQFLVVGFVVELFDLQRRQGLSGTPGFANAVWSLAMFEGLVRQRYPDLDFQAEILANGVSSLVARVQASAIRPCRQVG